MLIFIIIGFTLLGIFVDRYIYTYHFRDTSPKPWLKRAFVIASLTINLGTLTIMLLIPRIFASNDQGSIIFIMWMIFIFLLNFFPNLIFAFFSILRRIFSFLTGKRLQFIENIGWALAIGLFCFMITGSILVNSIRIEKVYINSDRIPASFDGYKIAFFSDTHIGNLGKNNKLIQNAVNIINAQNPDVIIFGGDLVNLRPEELDENIMRKLSGLRAPDGVLSVLGNHDLSYYLPDTMLESPHKNTLKLIRKQEQMGWRVLLDEKQWIHRGEDSIAIIGIKYPNTKHFSDPNSAFTGPDLEKAKKGISDKDFSILVSHTPTVFDSIPQQISSDLTLSGHIHSMQMKVRIGSWQWSPARFLYKMWSGLYAIDDRRFLYINDGLGRVAFPMRMGARPEITLIELRKTQ